MSSFFNLLVDKSEYCFRGTYYARKPKTTEDKGETFNYNIENYETKATQNVVNNIETVEANFSIKTVNDVQFNLKGYVVTQDGEMWQIVSMLKRPYKDEKEAFRIFKNSPKVETVLRMINVQNARNLK